MEKLSELEDPRQPSNGTRHDFREILVIAVCAMLSDADSFEDIALWGRLKADWLRRFLVLKKKIGDGPRFPRSMPAVAKRANSSHGRCRHASSADRVVRAATSASAATCSTQPKRSDRKAGQRAGHGHRGRPGDDGEFEAAREEVARVVGAGH